MRGDYKQSEYGKVILPFTVLRRLDCVLEPTKTAVLAEKEKREKAGLNAEPFLLKQAKVSFYNTSRLDLKKLMGDQGLHIDGRTALAGERCDYGLGVEVLLGRAKQGRAMANVSRETSATIRSG